MRVPNPPVVEKARKPLQRKTWMKASTKPVKKVNAPRMAKRKAAYQKFMHSAQWKNQRADVMTRDGFQCTAMVPTPEFWRKLEPECPVELRCQVTGYRSLTVHHLRYSARGIEHTPDKDLTTLCRHHHDALEAQKLTHR